MSSSSTVTAPTKRKLRPARKQVAPDEIDRSEKIQAGKEYNVWYNKWAGGDKEDDLANKTLAQTRCVISRDAGYTRADATGNKYCCLFFARGCCPYGQDCAYLHRLPLPSHQLPDNSRDCFGREKHGEYRDDMGGVGSFNRVNRTIYIAKMGETPDKKQVEETLLRHFKEWGKVIRHNILYGRGIAFVTYENELNAQFAKEAMANQSMDMDEILNVRWAIEDPNPGEVRREAARIEQLGKEAIKGMLDEGIVEAAQTIRALEDGDEQDFYPIEESGALPGEEEEDEHADGRAAKRIKSSAQAGDGTAKETLGSGLLSGEAMENLKYYADLARQQAEERKRKVPAAAPPVAVKKAQAKPTSGGLAALGGYASDSD